MQGIVYTKALNTGWKPKLKQRLMSAEEHQEVRPASVTHEAFQGMCPGNWRRHHQHISLRAFAWDPLRAYRETCVALQVRDKFHIICEGDNLPPAVADFADARLPLSIMKHLESKGIKRPTPIQMQVRFHAGKCFV